MDSRTETILFYGDSGVGKTSLIKRWTTNTFDGRREAESPLKYSNITLSKTKTPVHVKIYDISGERKYADLWPTYVRYSKFIVFVFDGQNSDSFENVKAYVDIAKENEGMSKPQYFLLANQCDQGARAVTEKMARDYAATQHLIYMETSAKTGHGIATFEAHILQLAEKNRQLVVTKPPVKEPLHLDLVLRIDAFQKAWIHNAGVGYICSSILKAGTQNENPQFYFTAKLPQLKDDFRYLAKTWRSVLNSILNVAMTVALPAALAGFACANLVIAVAGLLLFAALLQTNKKASGHSCMFFAFGEKQATQTLCNNVFTQMNTTVRI